MTPPIEELDDYKDPDFESDDPAFAHVGEGEEQEDDSGSFLSHNTVSDAVDTSWMVPYGNMVTILMIFFLVLYAFSQQKDSSFEKAIQEIKQELSTTDTTLPEQKEAEVAEAIETYLSEEKLKEYAQVDVSAQRIHITLSNPVLFDSGQARLKAQASGALGAIAGLLRGIPNPILVEGHTDNKPIASGQFKSNFELSAARAFSVIQYMVAKGVSPDRLSAQGYGEFRPVADNATATGRAQNRRIEIHIIRSGENNESN